MRFRAAREGVLQTCLELADRGYLAATGGNVALRADAEHFAVTPSATDYYTMTAVDVCIVRAVDSRQVDGERAASVEAGLHARVLQKRPDCGVSVHTHQPIASAYTLLGRPLAVEDPERRRLLGVRLACIGYAPSGTSWLAARAARAIDSRTHACLMRNHGVVCVGSDPDLAVERVAALESECAAFFEERLTTGTRTLVPEVQALAMSTLRSALGASN